MKNFFIILITKILIFIIKILGKTGGNFPGRFATNLNKDILKYKLPSNSCSGNK